MVNMSAVFDEKHYWLTFATYIDKLIKRLNSEFEHFCRENFSGNGGHYDAVFKRSLLIGQSA